MRFPSLSRAARQPLPFLLAAVAALCTASAGLRPAAAQENGMSAADMKTLTEYKLTLETVAKVDTISKKIADAAKTDAAVPKEMQAVDAEKGASLDQTDANFTKLAPHITAIIKGEGLTPREYLTGVLSTMFATMGVSMKQASPDKPLPDFVPAANVELAEKNPAPFESAAKSITALDSLSKGGG